MAGVDNIVLEVSKLTKVEELNAVTAAVNSRLAALRRVVVGGSHPTILEGQIKMQSPEEQLKEMEAILGSMRPQGDQKLE